MEKGTGSIDEVKKQLVRSGCTPISGAVVDIWHCDAFGVDSDVRDPGFRTTGQKFLRDCQVTDGAGQAKFVTIYPGWYYGRTGRHEPEDGGADEEKGPEAACRIKDLDSHKRTRYCRSYLPAAVKGQQCLAESVSTCRCRIDQLL